MSMCVKKIQQCPKILFVNTGIKLKKIKILNKSNLIMEKNEVFDYYQEVARSAFADMLHDKERNHKYAVALKEGIDLMKSRGKKANVLDIGTGSGLLAMLAARNGADSVVTIEAFSPVSLIARKIIEENGFKDKIKIINKHSTEVQVGEGKDMDQRANILVAEVFDTELIGEGAIKTYQEAHKHLMESDCISIPHLANVYVQIVESKLLSNSYRFKDITLNENVLIKSPDDVVECRGLASINDIQLSQLPLNEFNSIAGPIKICEFNFSGEETIKSREKFIHKFTACDNADSTIIFFWWDLFMNQSGSILLSCAPHWFHPDTSTTNDEVIKRNSIPWRDHWMQGCYFVPTNLIKDYEYDLISNHDEFSWFFDINKKEAVEQPTCTCLFHMSNSRNRIMQINDESKRNAFVKVLKNLKNVKNMLFIGDHSVVGLLASHFTDAANIFIFQEDELCHKSMRKFIETNNLSDKVNLINQLDNVADITHFVADPYFTNSVLPFDNITKVLSLIKKLRMSSKKSFFSVSPVKAVIYAVPVHFLNLHKIRWPLDSSCENFDHKSFDNVIELASKIADENIEPFSLWEYPCLAVGSAKSIFEVNFNDNIEKAIAEKLTVIEIDNFTKSSCNGVSFWIDWVLDSNDIIISTGPLEEIVSGELINWKFDRQTVHLIPHKDVVRGILKSIEIKLQFNACEEKIALDFTYRS